MMELKGQYSKFVGRYAKIYTLSDIHGNVFYVGCTVHDLPSRIRQHISEAKRVKSYGNPLKNKKIKDLDFNITAAIVDMVWVTDCRVRLLTYKASRLEKKWISEYRSLGYELVNRAEKPSVQAPKKINEYVGQVFSVSKETIKEMVKESQM